MSPQYASELFELLRTERDRIAETEGVLPYDIFHDKALQAMATYFPTSEESFRLMPNVGPARSEKYADIFLPIIREYFNRHGTDSIESGTEALNTSAIAFEEPNEYAPELFEQLRETRKTVADEEDVPAFVVFSDKTLQEMATHFPKNKETFMQIRGIAEVKCEKYADIFLPIIRAYCEKHRIPKMP